jgi:hypothetical protein
MTSPWLYPDRLWLQLPLEMYVTSTSAALTAAGLLYIYNFGWKELGLFRLNAVAIAAVVLCWSLYQRATRKGTHLLGSSA